MKVPMTSKKYVFEAIRRICGTDAEVVDAKEPLRLQPQPCDLVGADPKDPGNCVLVHTARRMYDARLIIFWKTLAYVELIGRDGKRRIERFKCSNEAVRQIEAFDRGQPICRGAAIVLLPFSRSERRAAKVKRLIAYHATRAGKITGRRNHLKRRVRLAEERVNRAKASLHTAKRDDNVCESKSAKAIVVAAESRLGEAQKQLSAFLKNHPAKKGPSVVFDLTTRNGAIGAYKFTPSAVV